MRQWLLKALVGGAGAAHTTTKKQLAAPGLSYVVPDGTRGSNPLVAMEVVSQEWAGIWTKEVHGGDVGEAVAKLRRLA